MAVGAALYDVAKLPHLGYGSVPGVLTSLELERLVARNGPSQGELRATSGELPERVAFFTVREVSIRSTAAIARGSAA